MQNIINILTGVVIFLYSITQQPIGTGFIVGYPISEDGKNNKLKLDKEANNYD